MTKIDFEECTFYHVIDLPGHGLTNGSWDFRNTHKAYLGGVNLSGKRVLELGTATGAHGFYLEKTGAEVVAYDLSPENSWDLLICEGDDEEAIRHRMRGGIESLNNGFLFCREKLGSNIAPAYGSIYDIPKYLGDFDVVTFGSILLHLRDPIGALMGAVKRARETVIITDRLPSWHDNRPFMEFIPKIEVKKPWGGWTWWHMSPAVYKQILELLGFKDIQISTSGHRFVPTDSDVELFTLVATR